MVRVELSDGWVAAGTVSGVQADVNRFLREWGLWVIGEQPGEVHARRASWLVRLLGRFAPAGWQPQRATVRLRAADGGVEVRAEIEEASNGGPPRSRLTGRYRAYFARWMAGLRARLPAAREVSAATGPNTR